MYRFTSPAVARHPGKLNADGSTGVPEMLLTMGKTSAMRVLLAFLLLPTCALGANSVVNMSHYDLMRPDFGGMAREGVAGVIHEATFRLERDARYAERQRAAFFAATTPRCKHFGERTRGILRDKSSRSLTASLKAGVIGCFISETLS